MYCMILSVLANFSALLPFPWPPCNPSVSLRIVLQCGGHDVGEMLGTPETLGIKCLVSGQSGLVIGSKTGHLVNGVKHGPGLNQKLL